MGITFSISVTNPKWDHIENLEDLIQTAANLAFDHAEKPDYLNNISTEINILLSNNDEVHKLNKTYRQKDAPTNVLSFPQFNVKTDTIIGFDDDLTPIGDIILAYETIEKEASEQEKPLNDHLTHLIIHGVLHLMGYDHMTEDEAHAMEKIECDIMAELNLPSPY